jgi:hypothetical protein
MPGSNYFAMAADRTDHGGWWLWAQKGDVCTDDKKRSTDASQSESGNRKTWGPGDKSLPVERRTFHDAGGGYCTAVTETQSFGTTVTKAPAAAAGMNCIRSGLLRILAEYARKYPASWNASLDSLPDITRESVLKASNMVYSYQQTWMHSMLHRLLIDTCT